LGYSSSNLSLALPQMVSIIGVNTLYSCSEDMKRGRGMLVGYL